MTEVGHADISRLLQSKRNECNAIVTSRKRKLRELFAVATHVGDLPDNGFANPDTQAATPAEWQFQQASDILQGKTLNEQNIPTRPPLSLDVLKRSLAGLKEAATRQAAQQLAPEPKKEPATLVTRIDRPVDTPTPPTPNAATTIKPVPIPANTVPTKTSPPVVPHVVRPPVAPERPISASPKANATPASVSPTPAGVNGVPKDMPTPAAALATTNAPNRPVQVTFPPGTKGSPSAEPTANATGAAGARDGTQGGVQRSPPVERSTLLPAKPASEATRGHDAASSPGSTAPSATTPAVHDASTDTSPDNEGVQYREESEVKSESGQDSEADPPSVAPEKAEPVEQKTRIENLVPESAEDQLLQESIQSAATAATSSDNTTASVENAKPVVDLPVKDASQPETASNQAPLPPSEPAQPPGTTAEPNVSQMEIPDSQEEVRDSMDVDGPDGSTDRDGPQPQKTLSPKEQTLPTPTIPTTPLLDTPAQKETSQVPERAVTRVSSGAMRLKSVNEIVGSTPRPSNDRSVTKVAQNQLTPVTSTPQSPASRHRHSSHKRERSKGQVSTVVFGKQPKKVEEKAVVASQKDTFQPSDDYFTPLFLQGFTASSNVMQPIEKILFHANKTVATPDTNLAIQDHQACKVLRRVYQLQQYEKWSLRQIKRCPEPTRPASQWDVVLQEMKWMRTDFREERKWKAAVAKNLAHACAHWHEASPEERKALQVPAFIPPKVESANDVSMADADEEGIDFQPTPDLISSGDVDSPQLVDELAEEFPETVPPSAIFTLQEDDVIFGLRRTQASDRLLDELPIYGSPLKIPRFDLTGPEYDPDAHWRRPALPLSKYVEGQMKVMSDGPPRKRSRYNYQNEDSEDEDGGFVGYGETGTAKLPPSSGGVALFNPESKPIRDRLHAGHQFRPPSEHPMPTQNFYECRSPSQWVMAEDDELRGLVRDYSYNWSLISSMLTTRSLFVSGAERRTPWECFERWINLEGLPADMQKTQYFKAYNSRIEAAQRVIAQQNQLAAQQANASGGAITPVRRRQSTPLRVERRRNQKHLTLIDAMRKLAKKRETTIQKQQHTASQSVANKKTNDAMSQRPTKTPRDYSLLRWERDQALAEKMAQYAQRQEAQRRAAMQARSQGQAGQMAGTPGVPQAAPAPNHAVANNGVNGVNRPNMPNQLAAAAAAAAAANQARPRMPMQAPVNGMAQGIQGQMGSGLMPPTPMNGVPQAQMQALQGQHRMQMPNQQTDANLMLRAQRISEQQRAAVQIKQAQQQQQQQQQPGGSGTPVPVPQQASPPLRNGMNGINQQSFINNAQAIMASFNANNNGHSTPPATGLHMPTVPNGTSPGPRVQAQIPPSITAQLQQLETTFRAKNPSMTPEQARQLATEHLTRAMMAQRQSAMNAAAGGSGQPGLANSIAATTSPHQYAALLRQQQQQQAQQQAQQQRQATPAGASPAHVQVQGQAQQQAQAQVQQHQQQQHQQQQHQQQHQQQRQASGSATPSLPPSVPTPATPVPAATPTPAPSATPVAK